MPDSIMVATKNVNPMLLEGKHDVFYLASTYLTVSHAHASLGAKLSTRATARQ